jgi:hypothetical protein
MRAAISSLEVLWAYVIEGLEIPVFAEGEEPRHLVLTGPNGSGKSSILRGLSLALWRWPTLPNRNDAFDQLGDPVVVPHIRGTIGPETLHAYFAAHRRFKSAPVSGPKRFAWPSASSPDQAFHPLFLQHLVNRRSEQAFAREGGDVQTADRVKHWFDDLEQCLRELLDSPELELRFDAKNFEFFLVIGGQKLGFDTLPDGFASVLTIWSDILLRSQSLTGDPSGFVIIDEPELHLHPELQELLLPFLTRQFPGLQFIVATHSPMIATSLTRSTIYDLEQRVAKHGEDMQGFRYGNVLKSHFGLRTDFDAATTAKLDRLAALRDVPQRTPEQQVDYRRLARELAEHGHLFALEVSKEFDDDD